jgi:hypothetical protein
VIVDLIGFGIVMPVLPFWPTTWARSGRSSG